MPEPVLRAALVGCGRIASGFADGDGTMGIYTHAQAYQACPRTELAAVCDVDAAKAEACVRRWGVPHWFGDPARMLDAIRPDLVSVCTPDETHAPLAFSLLSSPHPPRGLLCEKPLATTVAEARRVVALARAAGVRLGVNYFRRHLPNLRAVRDAVRGGEWGAVQSVHGWYTKGVRHNGTHWFDLVRFLLGEVVSVSGRLAHDPDSADPGVDAMLELETGACARLTSCDSRKFTVFEMDLMLEKGRLELREAALVPRLFQARPSARFAGYTELLETPRDFGGSRDSLLHAVEDLADAVTAGRDPLCSGLDGVAALAVAEAALESARKDGRPVPPGRYEA